ncbi:MAG: hypothetical protein IJ640_08530 [Prevotella sp.]|nr:hypothetical protein [Prevotella sp.]
MAAIKFDITGDNRNVLEAFNGVQQGVRQTQQVVEESGQSIEDMFKRVASAAGIAFSMREAIGFVDKVKEVRSFFQDIESSMEVFLGNQEKAAKFTQELKDYAFYNMFEFKDLAAASQQMIAYGNSVNDVIPILDKLSNVASGTNSDLMSLVQLYDKAKSTGYVDSAALVSWATKGVVVKDVLRDMGQQTDDTKVTFEQLNMVLDKLTGEGGMFHNLMLNQMENLSAEEGQLQDELDAMYNEIGEKYQDFLKGTIDGQIWLVEHYKEIGATLLTLVGTYGTYRAALMATRAVEKAEQNVEYKEHIKALDEEIAATKNLLPAKQDAKNADLAEAVAKKQLTQSQAELIAAKREELALLEQEREGLVKQSQGKVGELEQEVKFGEELVALYQREHDEAAESLRIATERKNKADEQVQSALDYLNAEKEIAATQGSALSDVNSAQSEYDAAVAEQLAAAKELESTAEAENTAETALNSVQKELNTVQEKLNTAQTELDTLANTKNTASTTANTAATTSNTVAQRLSTVAAKAHTAAQAILKVTIDSVKNSWNALKVAMAANPIGAVISALTLAYGLFTTFIDKEDEATNANKRFGDSADSAARDVNTLYAVLQSSSNQSKVHKDALAELKQTADEYGITINNEIDLESQLIEKKKELIGLIREEAIERQRANDIAGASDTLQENLDEAKSDLIDDLNSAWSDVEKNQIANLIDEAQTDALVEKMKAYQKALDDNKEAMGSNAYLARESREAYAEYRAEVEKVLTSLTAYGQELDKDADDIDDAKSSVEDYIRTLVKLRIDYDNTVEATNQAAIAAQNVEEAVDGLTDTERTANIQAKNAKKSIDDLYGSVANLLRDYANNNINFTLTVDSTQVPDWMKTELGIQGNGTGNLAIAQQRASYYAAQLEYMNSHPFYLAPGGETRDETATLAAQYAKAARDIQADQENWEKTKAQREKEAKKKAQEAKQALNERIRRMREIQRYNDLMEQQEQDRARSAVDMQHSTTQAEIDAMEDGTDKTIAQINLDFEKRKVEIDRAYEDLKQKKIDDARKLWEANPANKGKAFDESSVDSEYTDAEKENYRKLQEANTAEYKRRLKEQSEADQQAMYDYLKEYGSFQDRRRAINAEYETKIANESSEIRKRALQAERDKLLSEVNMQELQSGIDWETVFGNLNRYSVAALTGIKNKLRSALDAKDITVENAQILAQKINELEENISNRTDVWSSILPGLRERKRLTEQAAAAESVYQKALSEEVDAINKVLDTKKQIKEQLDKLDIRNAFGQKITVELEAISEENKEMLLSSLDKGSELYKGLLRLFENLAADQANLGQAHQTTEQKRNLAKSFDSAMSGGGLKQFANDLFNFKGIGFTEIAGLVNQNAQSLAEFTNKIGLEGTDFGNAVQGFADGVGGFNNAIQSLLNGDIFGAVNGVLDGVAGFGRMGINIIAGGGNEEEKEKENAELTKSQDRLTRAIEGLADKILKGETTNKESVEYYKKAVAAEKDWEQKQRKKIDNKASESTNTGYGFFGLEGKSSFNHHMAGDSWSGWKVFSDILKEHKGEDGVTHNSVNKGSIWNLSPEEMKLLQEFAPKEWDALFNGDGHRNPIDLVNEYIERAGKIEELTSALNEKLTGYSWDGFLDSYKSLLKDMGSETEDFTDKMEEIISNALLESLVNEEFRERIKDLYQYIADHAGDGLDEDELNYIRGENEKIANEMIARRQNLVDAGLLKPDDDYEQEASKKGFQSMSQETGEELNGRFTALQISGENISAQMLLVVATLNSVASFSGSTNTAVIEIRDMLIFTNSYLEDMVKYAKLLYNDFGEKLDDIVKNTK